MADEISAISRIGKDSKISGKLNFGASVSIEGQAEGEINGIDVVIAEGAVITAQIRAKRLTIAGSVKGEIITTERLELLPTARVRCTISTPKLVLNEGAIFDGDCKMPSSQVSA